MTHAHASDAPTPVRRALLSVSDKTGLIDFARALAALGIELVSTGGTAAALTKAGLPVIPVDQVTGFPEMLDGRVKTLHPHIHGAILARRSDPSHQQALRAHGITPIDLVCVSLYPFEQTIARPGVTRDEAIEQIDIGGPAMIRAAAKNHESVAVVTDPSQYAGLLEDLRANAGAVSGSFRRALAQSAYARTSAYDAAISAYLARTDAPADAGALPESLAINFPRQASLRYGENPHQHAAVYRDPGYRGPTVVSARQLHGKELSYNNINDAAAALALVEDLARAAPGRCAAAIIKHANPCGAAVADSPARAVELALRGDPLAAYGGILALASAGSRSLDLPAAELLCREGVFLEVVVTTSFDAGAVERLKAKSANMRLLDVGPLNLGATLNRLTFRSIAGGALAQSADSYPVDPSAWALRAGPALGEVDRLAAGAIWTIAKHLASNAIAIGGADPDGRGGVRLFGAGAGQMDRVTSCRLAIEKAGEPLRAAPMLIAASDAFFPFPDGPALLIDAGVKAIVHPGGSKRDQETFDLCNQRGVTCLTTGVRHFRH
jgi:phosphoribosylaminoimidazolecarboxamide formyltransferase/IMP cyclohydrolase